MHRGIQLACTACGPAVILLFVLGFVLIAGLLPAASPEDSAREIADLYNDGTGAIRAGVLISMVGWTLIGPWGITMAAITHRPGRTARMLTYTQLASAGSAIALVVLTLLVFGVAAFRPDDLPADTTRLLNDFAWFLFLFSWPPFSLWMAAIGLSILSDTRPTAPYPRWAGYLNLWVAFMIIPAGLIIFFKDGPFAFNGLLALYMPLSIFFVWIVTMTALTVRVIRQDPGEPGPSSASEPGARAKQLA